MQTPDVKFRPRPDQRAWLDHYAQGENRSLNGALADLIDRAMKADPLRIVVRHCNLLGMQFYDVSVGEHGDAFHEGQDKAAAIAAAHAKAKELGLPRSAVQYRTETEDGPAFGQVVASLSEHA